MYTKIPIFYVKRILIHILFIIHLQRRISDLNKRDFFASILSPPFRSYENSGRRSADRFTFHKNLRAGQGASVPLVNSRGSADRYISYFFRADFLRDRSRKTLSELSDVSFGLTRTRLRDRVYERTDEAG